MERLRQKTSSVSAERDECNSEAAVLAKVGSALLAPVSSSQALRCAWFVCGRDGEHTLDLG